MTDHLTTAAHPTTRTTPLREALDQEPLGLTAMLESAWGMGYEQAIKDRQHNMLDAPAQFRANYRGADLLAEARIAAEYARLRDEEER